MLAVLVAVTYAARASQGPSSVTSPKIVQAISWLPTSTETLVVAAVPGKVRTFDADEEGDPAVVRIVDTLPLLADVGLPNVDGNRWASFSYKFIVDGERNYRKPTGMGMPPFDGCTILDLAPADKSKLAKLAKKQASGTTTILGHRVSVMHATMEGDNWTWYVCFDGEYMFCSTDKDSLSQVLQRRASKQSGHALPDSLEQWKFISAGVPFFAVRSFTPTSDALKSVNMGDPQLAGYSIWLTKDGTKLNVASISNNPAGAKIAVDHWQGALSRLPWNHQVGVHPVDTRSTLFTFNAHDAEDGGPLTILLAALGHPAAT